MGCVFVLVCAFSSLCANLAGMVDLPILQVTVCVYIYIYIYMWAAATGIATP